MRQVNITELRNHLPKYLSSVQKGHTLLVTAHGQAIAQIIPPTDTQAEAIEQLKKLRKKCEIGDVISPINEKWDADK